MPKVYNRHDEVIPREAIYVGRPTVWGNPFRLEGEEHRQEVLDAFRRYAKMLHHMRPDWLEPLRGKDLVCWCTPKPCHADILVELANGP